jgi:CDP-glycerol glycerophosphotransferase (TagB/SpsB family)
MMVALRSWILRAAYALFRPLPLKDRIVLASSHTTHLTGNLESIAAELARRDDLAAPVVVLMRPHGRGLLGKAGVLLEAIRAEYYLATSRVFIVDDYFFPIYIIKPKPGTTIIQTWHASGAFKKIGYSVVDKTFGASEELVRRVAIHSNYTHILMGSHTSVPAYCEAFHQPAERFVTNLGIPRTDLFFDTGRVAHSAAAVRAKYYLPPDKNVILYAPTFRGTNKYVAAYHDDLDLSAVRKRCSDEYVLLLRLHPFVLGHIELDPSLDGFVFNVSDHHDINDLLIVSDLLITDYSSVIFEYSLLKRPMVFFAPDFASYEEERGFYFPYEEWVPGPVFTTSEQVAGFIAAGEFDVARVERFREAAFDIADGQASKRFVDELVLPALSHGGSRS